MGPQLVFLMQDSDSNEHEIIYLFQLRLDFETFTITGPSSGSGAASPANHNGPDADLGKVTLAYQVDDGNERKQTLVTYFSLLAGCGINGQITKGGANPGDCTKSGGEGLAAYWPYSQCMDDSFSVTNPGGISPPKICGKNQGRHSKLLKWTLTFLLRLINCFSCGLMVSLEQNGRLLKKLVVLF